MTIGENLKRARKKLNLSLNEAAERTKIAKMFLIALENDDIDSLPKGVYTRNFLRAYARFLQLDEDIITADYHEQYKVKPQFVAQQEQTKIDDLEFRKARRRLMLTVAVISLLLAGVGYYFLKVRSQSALQELWGELWDRLQGNPSQTTQPVSSDGITTVEGGQQSSPATAAGPDPGETAGQPGDMLDGSQEAVPETTDDYPEKSPDAADIDASPEETPGENQEPPGKYEAKLPSFELSSLSWTPEDRKAERIEDMFALESIQPVWIEVVIDGEVLTKRLLPTGQVRCYRYGTTNTVVIGDASRVAVQDGTAFKKVASAIDWTLSVRDFGPGDFFRALDKKIRERQGSED